MEQQYILKNVKSFNVKHIFECGQCFRWNREEDGSYTGVFKDNLLNVKQDGNKVIFSGKCNGNIETICREYFDLNTDYEEIKKELSKVDDNVKKGIKYGEGIRILNQDLWETIISFIISANNNIPRIKKIIERISEAYGEKIIWKGKTYYSFPLPEQLSKASVEDLRALGLGFRDKRVHDTTELIVTKKVDLEYLKSIKDSNVLREELNKLPGIGDKVADCIMLFSMKRFEVFPIDVWVRRVMNDLYIKNKDEIKVDKKQIRKLAEEKYGNLAGIAQQYLFYWKREEDKTA
jgi:N-glycosylase/DNA lyase